MSVSDFRSKYEDALMTAGQALENNGYDLTYYGAIVGLNTAGEAYSNFDSAPLAALEATIDDLEAAERGLSINLSGNEFAEVINGEHNPESLFTRNVIGAAEVDEPHFRLGGEKFPAFGTTIYYIPEFPDDHFEIGTAQTQRPYTLEDAEERVNDIVETLEGAGFETEIDMIQ